MAILKAGTTVDGSLVYTQDTHNNTGDPHSQYKLKTDLLVDHYTKTEVDGLITTHETAGDPHSQYVLDTDLSTNHYTKTEIDTTLNDYPTNTELTTNHYTKTEIDTTLGDYPTNTYLAANHYTETEVDNLLADVGGMNNIPVNVIGDTATNQTLDLSTYSAFELKPTAGINIAVSGLTSSKRKHGYLNIIDGGNQSLTWGSEIVWDGGEPTLSGAVVGTPWDVSNVVSDSKNFSVGSQETNPKDVAFNDDGTIMYVIGIVNDTIYQYTLSTAWDVTTASYASKSFSVSAQEGSPHCLAFKPDGTKVYVGGTSSDSVYEYDLSTAWDISTASYSTNSYLLTNIYGIAFKPDGTKMYLTIGSGEDIYEVPLSTAWDLSTTGSTSSYSFGTGMNNPQGFFFHPDGDELYVIDDSDQDIQEYTLSTPWDVTTITRVGTASTTLSSTATGMFPGKNGEKLYVATSGGFDGVTQYSMTSPVAGLGNLDVISLKQYGDTQVIGKLESTGVTVSV